MNHTTPTPLEITQKLKTQATLLGFSLVGVTHAVSPTTHPEFLSWLEAQYHGEMAYLQRRKEAYEDAHAVHSTVRSIVMLAANYANTPSPSTKQPRISRYAQSGVDYHDVLREKLTQLCVWLKTLLPLSKSRGIVDTAPLLERDFARQAGLGWFGKNTMLIHKFQGSYFFLSALLTDVELVADTPQETSHCGTCTRCLEACPTDAFVAPYQLDARRCISYLTIELRQAPIADDLKPLMDDWIFGCDVCQEVCPWNRKHIPASAPEFSDSSKLSTLDLNGLLSLTPDNVHQHFHQTPLERPGRDGIVRNAAIYAGNQRCIDAIPALKKLLDDPSLMVRDAAQWALQKLSGHESPSSQPPR